MLTVIFSKSETPLSKPCQPEQSYRKYIKAGNFTTDTDKELHIAADVY